MTNLQRTSLLVAALLFIPLAFQNCAGNSEFESTQGTGILCLNQRPEPCLVSATAAGHMVSCSSGEVILDAADADTDTKMQTCTYSLGFFGASGNGLSVDWGDGNVAPKYSEEKRGLSCEGVVRNHNFTSPGVYQIKVHSWHPGPTDAPITDWMGSVTVVVESTSDTTCP